MALGFGARLPSSIFWPAGGAQLSMFAYTQTALEAGPAVFNDWFFGTAAPAGAPVSQAGGTGSSARRRKIKRSSEVFHEEMEALELRLTEARDTRESIETTLAEVSAGKGDVLHGELRRLTHGERALRAAQMADAPDPAAIPVYIRIPKKSVGVKRVEAIERLRTLSRIARYREELASEKLRKVREKIDEDAAVAFMQAMMREWN